MELNEFSCERTNRSEDDGWGAEEEEVAVHLMIIA